MKPARSAAQSFRNGHSAVFDTLILQYRTDAESVAGLVHRIAIAKNPTGLLFRGRLAYRDADS